MGRTCGGRRCIGVLRGLRSRNSTDGVIPNRSYPTATLVSVDDDRLLPNYHLYSDLPDACNYDCIADAAVLTESVIRALSSDEQQSVSALAREPASPGAYSAQPPRGLQQQ